MDIFSRLARGFEEVVAPLPDEKPVDSLIRSWEALQREHGRLVEARSIDLDNSGILKRTRLPSYLGMIVRAVEKGSSEAHESGVESVEDVLMEIGVLEGLCALALANRPAGLFTLASSALARILGILGPETATRMLPDRRVHSPLLQLLGRGFVGSRRKVGGDGVLERYRSKWEEFGEGDILVLERSEFSSRSLMILALTLWKLVCGDPRSGAVLVRGDGGGALVELPMALASVPGKTGALGRGAVIEAAKSGVGGVGERFGSKTKGLGVMLAVGCARSAGEDMEPWLHRIRGMLRMATEVCEVAREMGLDDGVSDVICKGVEAAVLDELQSRMKRVRDEEAVEACLGAARLLVEAQQWSQESVLRKFFQKWASDQIAALQWVGEWDCVDRDLSMLALAEAATRLVPFQPGRRGGSLSDVVLHHLPQAEEIVPSEPSVWRAYRSDAALGQAVQAELALQWSAPSSTSTTSTLPPNIDAATSILRTALGQDPAVVAAATAVWDAVLHRCNAESFQSHLETKIAPALQSARDDTDRRLQRSQHFRDTLALVRADARGDVAATPQKQQNDPDTQRAIDSILVLDEWTRALVWNARARDAAQDHIDDVHHWEETEEI